MHFYFDPIDNNGNTKNWIRTSEDIYILVCSGNKSNFTLLADGTKRYTEKGISLGVLGVKYPSNQLTFVNAYPSVGKNGGIFGAGKNIGSNTGSSMDLSVLPSSTLKFNLHLFQMLLLVEQQKLL